VIERLVSGDACLKPEMRLDTAASRRSVALSQLAIAGEAHNGMCQGIRIARCDHDSGLAVDIGFGIAADAAERLDEFENAPWDWR
jgi:hypothetical protein